jgi:hypothetical protein
MKKLFIQMKPAQSTKPYAIKALSYDWRIIIVSNRRHLLTVKHVATILG